jgi:hypothetical protein
MFRIPLDEVIGTPGRESFGPQRAGIEALDNRLAFY